jgi:carboxylesterase type B
VPPLTVDATDLGVSQIIMGAWAHFVEFGDPRSVSLPQWTRYATSTDNFLEFADTPSLETGLDAAKCDVISTWLDEL